MKKPKEKEEEEGGVQEGHTTLSTQEHATTTPTEIMIDQGVVDTIDMVIEIITSQEGLTIMVELEGHGE